MTESTTSADPNQAVRRTPGGAIHMDGNLLRDETVVRLRAEIQALGNPHVCLATVLVGDDRPSQIYVRNKHNKAAEAGMASKHVELPPTEGTHHGVLLGRMHPTVEQAETQSE